MKTVATIMVLSKWFTENARKQVFYIEGGEITHLNRLKSHLIT